MKRNSLIRRLIYDFLFITLFPLLILIIGLSVPLKSSMSSLILTKNEELVRSLSRELQRVILQKEQHVATLEHYLSDEIIPEENWQPALDHYLLENPEVEMIQILKKNGPLLCISPYIKDLVGIDLSRNPSILQAQQREEGYWSSSFLSADKGTPSVSYSFMGDAYGIVLYLNLEFLGDSVNSSADGSGVKFILDREGTIIAHDDYGRVIRRERMLQVPRIRQLINGNRPNEMSVISENEILSLEYLDPVGWVIGFQQDKQIAFKPVRSFIAIGISLTLIMLILAAVLVFFILRNTITPLRNLLSATELASKGQYDVQIENMHFQEFENLGMQFRRMITSVSDREEELRKLRNYLSNIVDSMPSLLVGVDPELRIILWNNKAEQRTGHSAEDVRNKELFEILPSYRGIEEWIFRSKAEGRPLDCLDWVRHEGGEEWIEDITIYPLVSNGIQGMVLRIDDVTKQRELEKKLHVSDKLSSLGKLSAGIAHDINNMLTPIMGFSELILLKNSNSGERDMLQQIINAGVRAQKLISKLLAFSKKQPLRFVPLSLEEIISNLVPLLQGTIKENISIETHFSHEQPPILGDTGQIEQILLNLAVNAMDAMPSGGKLLFETLVVFLDEEYCRRHPEVVVGDYLMLTVSDTGTGMDELTQKKIFEPFFSTKGEQGTGLGLATAYGIIKQHKGHITLYSEEGIGTTFKVYFPMTDDHSQANNKGKKAMGDYRGTESILVVEDKEEVRKLIQMTLKEYGYHVECAGNGMEGLNLLKERKGKVDLLITDLIMPELNGKELAEKAEEWNPDLPILFMSGYTDNILSMSQDLNGKKEFISKPFSLTDLMVQVRKLLDSGAS